MSATEIADTSTINQSYGDAWTYNNNISTISSNVGTAANSQNKLAYDEITADVSKYPTLIDVGCICNTEYSNFMFNADRYWDKDAMDSNVWNSHKLLNDLEWAEQSNFHNGSIEARAGMVLISKPPSGYTADDVNFFADQTVNTGNISPDFNTFTSGGNGISMDIFGYFHPDATGPWQFILPSSNAASGIYTYLWINDAALYDYTAKNASINSTTSQNNNQTSIVVNLTAGDYIPIRIQIISKNYSFSSTNNIPLIVTPPKDSAASNPLIKNPQTNWNYFVTFVQNNTIYYKKLMYFGLVQDKTDASKFDCFFINTTDANVKNIKNYKENQQLQYLKIEIPTPTTFSGKGTLRTQDGSTTNLKIPAGIPLIINKATYGLDYDYTYNTYKSVSYQDKQWTGPNTYSKRVESTNQYKPTKDVLIGKQGHYDPVTRQRMDTVPVTVSQQKDVTAQVQSIVNSNGGNQLIINTKNYGSIFGNPITDANDPNINIAKNLTVQYSYSQDEANVDGKNIFVDPTTGYITIGFTYSGYEGVTLMNMDKTPSCPSGKCSTYRLSLTNNGTLSVLDGNNNEIGLIDLTKYTKKIDPKFSLDKCQVNHSWINNPLTPNSIIAGDKLSIVAGNQLVSSDGRFKLSFEGGKLILSCCYIPYTVAPNGFKYSTLFNVSSTTNGQIYYLYRVSTRGLVGRKFLKESDNSTGVTTMHYLPNASNNVLKYTSFYKPVDKAAYPIHLNGSLANSKNYKTYNNIDNTTCANKCISDSNYSCEHYFFINNNDNTTACYTDTVADSNPTFTNTKNSSTIRDAALYKKKYTITSTCGTVDDAQQISFIPSTSTNVSTYTVDYRAGQNAPNMTYYCGLDRYIRDNNAVLGTYKKDYKEGMTTANGDTNFHANAPYVATNVTQKFPELNNMVQQYSQLQDQIGERYDQTLSNLKKYVDISNQLIDPQYNYQGTDSIIPPQFVNSQNPKPNISFQDGMQKDVEVMLLQQNTLYTLASISAATLLVMAIAFGGE
jgi:hypothetical protein